MRLLSAALSNPSDAPRSVLLLDGLTTPANVGMILRTATAAGIDGIVLPHRGVASLDPLVVKASAGIAFHAPILRAHTAGEAAEQLTEAGYPLFALDARSSENLFESDFGPRSVFVLGSETAGLTPEVRDRIATRIAIPMHGNVESLNVGAAAAIVCYEVVRRSA